MVDWHRPLPAKTAPPQISGPTYWWGVGGGCPPSENMYVYIFLAPETITSDTTLSVEDPIASGSLKTS